MDAYDKPKSFYKYCPVDDDANLEKQYAIKNLLNNHALFSSRKNFSDPSDSKVDFILPTRSQLKAAYSKVPRTQQRKFKKIYLKQGWEERLQEFQEYFDVLLDTYLFYCVTNSGVNELMWKKYASSHKGFCIEWDSTYIKAELMTYKERCAKIKLIDWIKHHAEGGFSKETLSKETVEEFSNALYIKLKEFKYEYEYRFWMGDSMDHLIVKREDNFSLIRYDKKWIKSIIWGNKTTEKTKNYIREKLPHYNYKQACKGISSIAIKDEDPAKHGQKALNIKSPESTMS